MEDLGSLVRGYFESAGFRVIGEHDHCLVADKLIFGQDRDTRMVWTIPGDVDPAKYEPSLRASIARLGPRYPEAKSSVVAWSRAGFTREVQQLFSDQRIKFLVPIWFFDAAFKVEEAPKAASAIADFRSLDILSHRTPQPYSEDREKVESDSGVDLYRSLRDELNKDKESTIRVIVGRAGAGKTFLFRALFARLYDNFLQAKGRQEIARRPVPLLPDHLKGTYALRTELLIENFLRTDVATPVSRETFEWLLVNGFTTWLFDGLDELYAGDKDFFDYLGEIATRKGSKAQITIWCRDSLLTTSDAFSDFRELFGSSLKVYHLSDWQRPSKRHFAWLSLENRPPGEGASDPPQVAQFMHAIDASPTIRSLSGLPFYCKTLLDQYREGGTLEFADDVSMLNSVVGKMIERETAKGLIDLRLLEPNGLRDWLEEIAVSCVENPHAEVDRGEVDDYGRMVVLRDVDNATRNHILLSLLQFPLFQAGSVTGRIAFAHELIAQAVAANFYVQLLGRDPSTVARRLANIDTESPILRFIAKKITPEAIDAVKRTLAAPVAGGRTYELLLTLLMLASPEADLVKSLQANMEGCSLAGVRFMARDLRDVSFRRTDLSSTQFYNCDLRGARFEGAYLNRTRFEGSNQLGGAEFGDIGRVISIFAGKELLDDPSRIKDWISQTTGRPKSVGEPCATAQQLQRILSKFVTPLGEPKRDQLDRHALVAGRHYNDAAGADKCVDGLTDYGYLAGPDFRGRFRRSAGDKYKEIVELVRDASVSDGLGRLIGELCPRRGCLHQLRP
jgi:hypothetical protein